MRACEQQKEESGTVMREQQHERILCDMVAPKWAKSWGGKVS